MVPPTPAAPPTPGPWVEAWLSAPRLAGYRAVSGGTIGEALKLYEWNAAISAAFQRDLSHLEIGLRNACDAVMIATSPRDAHRLLDPASPVLRPLVVRRAGGRQIDLNDTSRAEVTAARTAAGANAPVGKVIAELGLGFRVHLHDSHHEKTIWVRHLHHAYPIGSRRASVHRVLESARLLRNRIAHHEPIFHLDLAVLHARLVQACGWISLS